MQTAESCVFLNPGCFLCYCIFYFAYSEEKYFDVYCRLNWNTCELGRTMLRTQGVRREQ